jgi:hypothetical protein
MIGLLAAGCQHAAAPRDEPGSSYRFITPPPPPSPPASERAVEIARPLPTEQVEPAAPILPLAKPAYPRIPPAQRPPFAQVGVRLEIDAQGRVAEVKPSLYGFSTPGPFAEAFHAAVEVAVAQWRFTPATLHRFALVPAAGGGQVSQWKGSEPIEWSVDVAFTFNGDGEVVSGAGGDSRQRKP